MNPGNSSSTAEKTVMAAVLCASFLLSPSQASASGTVVSQPALDVYAYSEKPDLIPARPVLQTCAGWSLATGGLILFLVGGFQFISSYADAMPFFKDENVDYGDELLNTRKYRRGLTTMGIGTAVLVPGIMLIKSADKKWKVYHSWKNNPGAAKELNIVMEKSF